MTDTWTDLDPFDLPEWLGVDEVTWAPDEGLRGGIVAGHITSDASGESLPCDLMAADVAHPAAVVPEDIRVQVHQAWARDEVLLIARDDRVTVAAPGIEQSAGQVLEMLRRFAKAVGARPERFAARLHLSPEHTACRD